MTRDELLARFDEMIQWYSGLTAKELRELKQQTAEVLDSYEPRVMTLQEVKACNRGMVFEYNPRLVPGHPVWVFCEGTTLRRVVLHSQDSTTKSYREDEYGTAWRCWTGQTTKARMREEPWT